MSSPDQPGTGGDLLEQHGPVPDGRGMLPAIIAFSLAVLSVLAVLAFRFPSWLSTPELRARYDVQTLRYVLFAAMVLAGGLSLRNLILGQYRMLAAAAFGWVVLAQVLGGPGVQVGEVRANTPYVGVDFFILDLLASSLVFIVVEKLRPLRPEQPTFRAEWQTDLVHFCVNHLVVGLTLLLTNRFISTLGFAVSAREQSVVKGLPFVVNVFLVFLCADLVQYWLHRAMHEVPALWKIHAVHHSAEAMDWLAGSRLHLGELLATRILVMTPLVLLGFPRECVDAYILLVGFQAVFDHSNVSAGLGPLKYVFVTPNFHHWHHSRDDEAIDKNYAAHFAFLDYLFGTAVTAGRDWPHRYGVVGDYMPKGWWKQQGFPFFGSTKSRETPRGS